MSAPPGPARTKEPYSTKRAGDRDLPPGSFDLSDARRSRGSALAELRRRLDLAGDDLGAEAGDRLEELGGHVRVDPTHADALVLQVERQVRATLELAALRGLDGQVHAGVDALHGARQDVRR